MSIEVKQEAAKLEKESPYVELFSLDLSKYADEIPFGQPIVYYWIKGAPDSGSVEWQGNEYVPFDIEATGFEWNGQGQIPTPTLTVSNTTNAIFSIVDSISDIVGAKVTRTRTYKKFLDGEPDANPNAHYPTDVYYIERKKNMNKYFLEVELASPFDQQGKKLPSEFIVRDVCMHRYRIWDAVNGVWDYSKATCPWGQLMGAGTPYYDIDGNVVPNPQDDKPSFKVTTCCKARFGANGVLPFRGAPGAQINVG